MAVTWTRIQGSKALKAVGYEVAGSGETLPEFSIKLHVAFKRGKTYVYKVPTIDYYDRFVSAPSKGRFYVFVIKAKFDYISRY